MKQKTKPQPLDLEEKELLKKFGYNEDLDLSPLASNIGFAFNDSLKELIKEIKQRLKSACEFYLRYKDKPELLFKDFKVKKIGDICNLFGIEWTEIDLRFRKGKAIVVIDENYNEWLFKLTFKPILKNGEENEKRK